MLGGNERFGLEKMTHGEIEIKKYQCLNKCPNQHEGTTWYSTVVLIPFT